VPSSIPSSSAVNVEPRERDVAGPQREQRLPRRQEQRLDAGDVGPRKPEVRGGASMGDEGELHLVASCVRARGGWASIG
jgi:hypothetical protein